MVPATAWYALCMSVEDLFDRALAEYKAAAVEFVPVQARRGRVVHATSMVGRNRTTCGRKFQNWVVVAKPLSCLACALAVHIDARPPRKREKQRRR